MTISLFLRSFLLTCIAALLSASSCQRDYSYLSASSCQRDYSYLIDDHKGPCSSNLQSREHPIAVDVVIPCTAKDLEALTLAINGARTHVANLRRVIVVSKERITHDAEWFPESAFPFQIQDIYSQLRSNVCNNGKSCHGGHRTGWLYQQLLKLYSPVVIPEISTNVLVLDADTIFLRPVHFVDEKDGAALFAVGTEYHKPYFEHAKRLFPFFRKVNANHSGIAHHMLFQRHVIEDIFRRAERIHNKPFWQAFIDEIDPKEADASAASEYELYFNYVLDFTTLARVRELRWKNVGTLHLKQDTQDGFDFVSWHHYLRPSVNVN